MVRRAPRLSDAAGAPRARRSSPAGIALAALALGGCQLEPGEPTLQKPASSPAATSPEARPQAVAPPKGGVSAPGQPSRRPAGGTIAPASVARETPSSPEAWVAEERLLGGATAGETLPLVVALHGLGDRPERFVGVVEGLPLRARVLAPRAFAPWGDGFSWFPFRREATPAERATAIGAAVDTLAPLIERAAREHPTRGKPLVLGFSQGGMLSFALAVRHPDVAAAVFPLGGALPAPLWPAAGSRVTPIVAFHGAEDTIVPAPPSVEAVEALRGRGATASLRIFPGVAHEVPREMRTALFEAVVRAAGL